MGKQKFDGYADKYDEWFMKNENLFTSELLLFKKVAAEAVFLRAISTAPISTGSSPLKIWEG